jgi:hypothetical protein
MKMALLRTLLTTTFLTTLACISAGQSAFADTGLPVSTEALDIQQILNNLGNINPIRGDAKSNESIMDIIEMKSQVESLRPMAQDAITPALQTRTDFHALHKPSTLARKAF